MAVTAAAAAACDGAECDLQAPLEWHAGFDMLRPILSRHLAYTDSILLLGPGRSSLHAALYTAGYRGLTVVDCDLRVLQMWRQRAAAAGHNSLRFELADVVTGLPFEHHPYSAVIDKGCLDCVLARPTGEHDGRQALQVVWNNLKQPGVFLCVSHSSRVQLLRAPGFKWDSVQVKLLVPGKEGSVVIRELSGAEADVPLDASFVHICKRSY